jgi:hypothetical protein
MRLGSIREPRCVLGNHDIIDKDSEREIGNSRPGAQVIDITLPGESAGDEEQIMSEVSLKTKGCPTRRCVDEKFRVTAAEITPENVACEELACVESGPGPGGDALRRGGTRQNNHLW